MSSEKLSRPIKCAVIAAASGESIEGRFRRNSMRLFMSPFAVSTWMVPFALPFALPFACPFWLAVVFRLSRTGDLFL